MREIVTEWSKENTTSLVEGSREYMNRVWKSDGDGESKNVGVLGRHKDDWELILTLVITRVIIKEYLLIGMRVTYDFLARESI